MTSRHLGQFVNFPQGHVFRGVIVWQEECLWKWLFPWEVMSSYLPLKRTQDLSGWLQPRHLWYSGWIFFPGFVDSQGVGHFARPLALLSKRVWTLEVSGSVKASTFSIKITFVSLDWEKKPHQKTPLFLRLPGQTLTRLERHSRRSHMDTRGEKQLETELKEVFPKPYPCQVGFLLVI